VDVRAVSQSNTQAEFQIYTDNAGRGVFSGVGGGNDYNNRQYDVRVKFELSPGLRFASAPSPPDVVAIDERTRLWNVGIIGIDPLAGFPTRTVTVIVTPSPSLEEFPLAKRCLTATVEHVMPAFDLDLSKRVNDVSTACLGDPPDVVVNDGDIVLWWLHDCVGVTTDPCGTDDDLKLFAYANSNDRYFDPEVLIIQVKDPLGRAYDSHTNSVNSGAEVSWQTRSNTVATGIQLKSSMENLAPNSSSWSTYGPETGTLRGWNGAPAPGKVGVRFLPSFNRYLDLAPSGASDMQASFTNAAWLTPLSIAFEFETLGTYVVNYKAEATRTDNTKYAASGDYTFHVGPIAELAVMDGGEGSPLAAPDQQAYTIQAVNDGPDTAPAVKVALFDVPEGAEVLSTAGTYREYDCQGGLCRGEWDLGETPISDVRPSGGQTEFPTLTLIADADAPASIEASIANTEDYSVTIDGTVHSTHYLDYIEENNAATVAARPGTGEDAPGTPKSLAVQLYSDPLAAILSWQAVERVNLFPVTHYQVHESSPPCQRPGPGAAGTNVLGRLYLDASLREGEDKCYVVRAVNSRGVPGYWSRPVQLSGVESPQPPHTAIQFERSLILSESSVTAAENGGTASYTVALYSQPTGEVRVALASGNTSVAAVSPASLTFTADNWQEPQRVTVTGVNDHVKNPESRRAAIRHRAQGGGYGSAPVATLEVVVTDDDAAVTGMELSVSPQEVAEECKQPEDENCGPTRVEVTATLAGATRFAQNRTVTVSVQDSGRENVVGFRPVSDFRITIPAGQASGSGAFTLTPVDDREHQQTETVTVSGTAEGLAVSPAHLRLSDGDARPVIFVKPGPAVCGGQPASFTLELDTNPNAPGLQPYGEDVLVDLRGFGNRRAMAGDVVGMQVPIPAGKTVSEPFTLPTQDPYYPFSKSEHFINDNDLASHGIPTDRRPRYPLDRDGNMPGHEDDIFKWANGGADVIDSSDPNGAQEATFLEYLRLRVESRIGPGFVIVQVQDGGGYTAGGKFDDVEVFHSKSSHPSCYR